MRPRLKSVGFALTQFSVGIATLLLSCAPLPPILPLTEVAQAQTIQERQAEADRLLKQGSRQRRSGEFTSALGSYQQALKIYQEIKNPQGETTALGRLSGVYFDQKNYPQAIEYAQKQLELAGKIQDYKREDDALSSLYKAYMEIANYAKAIEYAQKQLELAGKIQDYEREDSALSSLYRAYMEIANYAKAIETAERMVALTPRREGADITEALGALARAYAASGNQAKADKIRQRIDEIRQRIDSEEDEDDQQEVTPTQEQNPQVEEAERLRKQARQYQRRDEYESAIQIYQQALEIYRSIRDRNGEAGVLEDLGDAYRLQSKNDQGLQRNYDQEIDAYQQALKIYRETGNRQGEMGVLSSLRSVYDRLQDLPKAIEYTEQELKLVRELRQSGNSLPVDDESGDSYSVDDEIEILVTLREFYMVQANYAKAIEVIQDWLSLAQQSEDADGERRALEALAKTYAAMGDTAKSAEYQSRLEQRQQSGINQPDENTLTAIERYQQQLAEARKRRDRRGEMNAHEALRKQYYRLGDYTRAVSHAESGLQIAKEINDRKSVLEFALKTGGYYSYLSDWKKALASYMQGIEYHRQHPSREFASRFARLLHRAGDVHRRLDNRTQALDFYQQAYVVWSEQTDYPEVRFVKDNDTGADLGGESLADSLTELYIELGNYDKAIETALAILDC